MEVQEYIIGKNLPPIRINGLSTWWEGIGAIVMKTANLDQYNINLQRIYHNKFQGLTEYFRMILNNLPCMMRIKYLFTIALPIIGGVILKMIPIQMMFGNLEAKGLSMQQFKN